MPTDLFVRFQIFTKVAKKKLHWKKLTFTTFKKPFFLNFSKIGETFNDHWHKFFFFLKFSNWYSILRNSISFSKKYKISFEKRKKVKNWWERNILKVNLMLLFSQEQNILFVFFEIIQFQMQNQLFFFFSNDFKGKIFDFRFFLLS